jgi:hypothetical protein
MTTANEIQQLALDVFENKLDYKDNDFICVMNLLKESYMRIKGILNDKDCEKETEEEAEEEEETDDEYFLRTHRYTNYYSDDGSDSDSDPPY